jgi:hypothetical protein
LERIVILKYLKMQFVLALVFAFGFLVAQGAATDPAQLVNCASDKEVCLNSCGQFETDDDKFSDCKNSCQGESKRCSDSVASSSEAGQSESPAAPTAIDHPPKTESPTAESSVFTKPPIQSAEQTTPAVVLPLAATPTPQLEDKTRKEPQPRIRETLNAQGCMRERKLNDRVQYAIRAGDFQTIRHLISVVGLSPTYVDSYERVPHTEPELYNAKVSGLWLNEIFNANTTHTDASGVDHVLALFIELGMDIKATMDSRTAWGPDFRAMEGAKDRASRLQALELALQAGLKPNDDLGEQLFTELPQICGRDKSKFAIEVVDVLVKYLGPSLKKSLRRDGEQGPETIDLLLDRSFSPHRPTNAREKELFAEQDERWENCQPLARRIHRFLDQGK